MTENKKINSFLKQIRKTTNSVSFENSQYSKIDHFISTGDYGLNLILTGNTNTGIPAGKVILLGGESQCVPKTEKVLVKLLNNNNLLKEIPICDIEFLKREDFLIDTPDGWKSVGRFFNKGILQCFKIKTDNFELIASEKHLIQLKTLQWKTINNLKINTEILTKNGIEKINSIEFYDYIECVDIEIMSLNHRYYINGISSHNSGKSLLAAQIAANALTINKYDIIFYFDSEGGALNEFFESRGCNLSKIEHVLVESVEDAALKILSTYKKVEKFMEEEPNFKALFILDSLGALVTGKFVSDAESNKMVSDMGLRAKICNNFIKGCTIPALKTQSSLIIINHIYDNPASLFTSKLKQQSGGKGLQYMSRITLQCSKIFEKNEEKNDVFYKSTILKFFTVKNSFIKPFFESQMYLDFAKGPHKYFGLIKFALKWDLITTPVQGYYSFPFSKTDPSKKYRMKNVLDNDAEWETLLPLINEKAKTEMSYSGNSVEDFSEDSLNNIINAKEEEKDSD